MSKSLILLIAAIAMLFVGCSKCDRVDTSAEKAAVKKVLDDVVKSSETRDVKLYEDALSKAPSNVYFGVLDPTMHGWEEATRMAAGEDKVLSDVNITVSDEQIAIGPLGDVAWASSKWDFACVINDFPVALDFRCSWVLQKEQDQWKIVHFHTSVAAGSYDQLFPGQE
jgi:hypothetical protein